MVERTGRGIHLIGADKLDKKKYSGARMGLAIQDPIQVACQDTDTTDIASSVNHQECGGYLGQEGRRIPELRSS